MKILIIGGTGLIGRAVVSELGDRHEVLTASRNSGNFNVDITSTDSIKAMFDRAGSIDAIISTTGQVEFVSFEEMQPENYQLGLDSKLMGQVNLVLIGRDYLNDAGSFTLTTGILNVDPIATGSSAAMVNAGVEGFVKSAAIEMPKGFRINAVSPTVVLEAMDKYAPYFRGYEPVPVAKAALAYSKSVEGHQTGQVIRSGY